MVDVNEFFREFQVEVVDFAQGGEDGEEGDFKENAFTTIIAEDLSAAGILESPDVCYFEAGPRNRRMKVNGCSVPEEDTQLDLFVSIYSGGEEPAKISAKDIDRVFGQLTRFLEAAVAGYHEKMEPGSDQCAMVREVWSLRDTIDRVRLVLFTDGIVVQRKEKERKGTVADLNAAYEIWDIERLRRFRSSGTSHESVEVDLSRLTGGGVPCVGVGDEEFGYHTSVTVLPGQLLHDLFEDYGQRLLELNVRSYLQARGKVNAGILETLHEEPERFFAYNNGITIVAEEVGHVTLDDGAPGIGSIRGLQVVNGGQTTASIHRAGKGEKTGKFKGRKADLSSVFVQAKITVIDRDQFDTLVPLISKYANSQNKVSDVDLRANHAYHVGVERVSRKTWAPGEQSMWFYERARGSYQTQKARTATTPAKKREFEKRYPPKQRFSKEDLARYENCWHGEPHIVSRGGQKNFASFMTRVGEIVEGWAPSQDEFKGLIGKAILYRQTQKIVRELGIPAFRVNVVNYTVAAIAHKTARRVDLERIWDNQDLTDALRDTLRDWAGIIAGVLVESAGERNPTEWFKREECWKRIRDLDLEIPDVLRGELTGRGALAVKESPGKYKKGKGELSDDDLTNIARCKEIGADQWHEIVKWGQESGELKHWQCGIANTLSGYAAGGWKRPISKKQALRGVEILKLAESLLSGSK